jgi:hypothetical protein
MKPPRSNEQWTEDDYETLKLLWETDATLEDLCLALGRSASSVVAQLANKGYAYFSPKYDAYVRIVPVPILWTTRELREINQKVWPEGDSP